MLHARAAAVCVCAQRARGVRWRSARWRWKRKGGAEVRRCDEGSRARVRVREGRRGTEVAPKSGARLFNQPTELWRVRV